MPKLSQLLSLAALVSAVKPTESQPYGQYNTFYRLTPGDTLDFMFDPAAKSYECQFQQVDDRNQFHALNVSVSTITPDNRTYGFFFPLSYLGEDDIISADNFSAHQRFGLIETPPVEGLYSYDILLACQPCNPCIGEPEKVLSKADLVPVSSVEVGGSKLTSDCIAAPYNVSSVLAPGECIRMDFPTTTGLNMTCDVAGATGFFAAAHSMQAEIGPFPPPIAEPTNLRIIPVGPPRRLAPAASYATEVKPTAEFTNAAHGALINLGNASIVMGACKPVSEAAYTPSHS